MLPRDSSYLRKAKKKPTTFLAFHCVSRRPRTPFSHAWDLWELAGSNQACRTSTAQAGMLVRRTQVQCIQQGGTASGPGPHTGSLTLTMERVEWLPGGQTGTEPSDKASGSWNCQEHGSSPSASRRNQGLHTPTAAPQEHGHALHSHQVLVICYYSDKTSTSDISTSSEVLPLRWEGWIGTLLWLHV